MQQQRADHIKELMAQGFKQHTIHNVYVKDGVATSLEHIASVGIEKALVMHGHVVASRGAR
jgi:hypothetical protein